MFCRVQARTPFNGPCVRTYVRTYEIDSGSIGRGARSDGVSVSRRLGASGSPSVLLDVIVVFLARSVGLESGSMIYRAARSNLHPEL